MISNHDAVRIAAVAAFAAVCAWTGPAASQKKDAKAGTVTGTVTLEGKKDHAGVVVTIEEVPGDRPEKAGARVTQRDKQFTPDLTVVTKGSKVEFPNEDKIAHNVFSVSRAARFDLGLYKSGHSKTVKLRREGEIDVYCNIHPNMVAKIKVVDTSYYAVTGSDGRFRIDGVPAGTYPIKAWQKHGDEYEGTVTVKPGGTAKVTIELDPGKKERRHLRKDGTPYPRYK